MFVTGLVNLYTRDIEAGLHFYRDLLGFAETFRTPTKGIPEHVELRLNGFTVGLGTVEAARNVHGVEAAPGSPAMALVVWTDDVDKAHAELVAAGRRPQGDMLISRGNVVANQGHPFDADGKQVEAPWLRAPPQPGGYLVGIPALNRQVRLSARGAADLEFPGASVPAGDHAVHQDARVTH